MEKFTTISLGFGTYWEFVPSGNWCLLRSQQYTDPCESRNTWKIIWNFDLLKRCSSRLLKHTKLERDSQKESRSLLWSLLENQKCTASLSIKMKTWLCLDDYWKLFSYSESLPDWIRYTKIHVLIFIPSNILINMFENDCPVLQPRCFTKKI